MAATKGSFNSEPIWGWTSSQAAWTRLDQQHPPGMLDVVKQSSLAAEKAQQVKPNQESENKQYLETASKKRMKEA